MSPFTTGGKPIIQATEIDLQQFGNPSNYNFLSSSLGRNVKILYVADLRSIPNTESGVRLTNGVALPAAGLTVATPNPLYVKGHYNAPNPGTTNTAGTAPASLVADAVTILSGNWTDPNSTNTVNNRVAVDTTINSAVLMGIVPSDGTHYSGGVENCLRLLESWNSRTLTFNGSLAALFPSRTATAPWGNNVDINTPPQRAYSFDSNFKDDSKLPPGTPELRTLIRAEWTITQANSTQ